MIDIKNKKKGDKIWYASSDIKKLFIDGILVVDLATFVDVEPNTNNGIIVIDDFRDNSTMYRVSTKNTFETKIEAEVFAAINCIKRFDTLIFNHDKKIMHPNVLISKKVIETYFNEFPDLVAFHIMKTN